MKSLGMRHVALNVKNAQASKEFYCKVMKMEVESNEAMIDFKNYGLGSQIRKAFTWPLPLPMQMVIKNQ
jgi:catechol 2,3-dioxygenase-like lactoylglutathione lyase family enzyme